MLSVCLPVSALKKLFEAFFGAVIIGFVSDLLSEQIIAVYLFVDLTCVKNAASQISVKQVPIVGVVKLSMVESRDYTFVGEL